jgi:triosephosphate isomerase
MKFQLSTIITIASSLACSDAFSLISNSHKHVQSPTFTSTSLNANRQPIMAGNWKMNPATMEEAVELASGLTTLLGEETCPMDEENEFCTEVVVFPPHPFLSNVKDVVDEVGITIGAQSIFFEDKGAYTGSVAASMVKSVGCEYVLCGHSERRTLFSDSDDAINRKVRKVLEAGMKPILCIGETKEEYDLQIKNEVCAMQMSKDLAGVTKEQMKDVVIAYEPVWAIGTGLVCGAKDASKYTKC